MLKFTSGYLVSGVELIQKSIQAKKQQNKVSKVLLVKSPSNQPPSHKVLCVCLWLFSFLFLPSALYPQARDLTHTPQAQEACSSSSQCYAGKPPFLPLSLSLCHISTPSQFLSQGSKGTPGHGTYPPTHPPTQASKSKTLA